MADAPRPGCNLRLALLQYDGAVRTHGERQMGGEIKKEYDLGKSGRIVCHVSEDGKRLLIEFDVDKEGLNKTGVNGLIEALKKIREKMVR